MSGSTLVRVCLAILALAALSVGLPAAFAPETFYEDYPFWASWVNLLPPYNEHLITDVGGLYLGFGFLFVWALIRPSRELILPLCVAWFLTTILHFAFHIGHLDGSGPRPTVRSSFRSPSPTSFICPMAGRSGRVNPAFP